MYMAGHNAPAIDFHSLILSAEVKAFRDSMKIQIAGKNIKPINCCKTYKVKPFLIVEFVLSAHRAKVGFLSKQILGNEKIDWLEDTS